MNPTPAQPPAPAAPPPITTEQLHAWIGRRRRFRGRLRTAVAVVLSLAAAAFAIGWTFLHHQFVASGSLQALGFAIDWDFNLGNFLRGGTTSVIYRPFGGFWSNQEVRPGDLQSLKALQHVLVLDISALRMKKDEDYAVIADLPELTDLELNRSPIGDGLRQAPPRQGYEPDRARLTDRVVDYIQGLRNLKNLGLAENRITDVGVARLANLKELESLDLDGTSVTDRGLEALKGLKKLRYLRVVNTKVTAQGVADFQRAMPDVEVTREDLPLSELAK